MLSRHSFSHLSGVENDWSDSMNPGRRDTRQAILRRNSSYHPTHLIDLASKRHQKLMEIHNEQSSKRQKELFLRHHQTLERLLEASEPNSVSAQKRLVGKNHPWNL